MPEKSEKRKRLLALRRALSRESVEMKSRRVIEQLFPLFRRGSLTVLLYVPIFNEVDLIPLARDLYLSGHRVYFPRLVRDEIVPYVIRDLYFDFKPGAYNIPEPDTEPWTGNIDLALVPGVAFGEDGYRIGYGKGYYDRFLSRGHVREAVGVCFDFQLERTVPHGPHDYRLSRIASESGLIVPERPPVPG